ncbi:MAG: hypothetical protein Q8P30_01350 [Candidatus Uhrbacteria bacterium]|nr:hypothetical protein [Candidatus Uhrbacteria bacterium]
MLRSVHGISIHWIFGINAEINYRLVVADDFTLDKNTNLVYSGE